MENQKVYEELAAPEPEGTNTGVWPLTACRQADGGLEIGGVSTAQIASDFGTPIYVLDEVDFRTRAAAWKQAMDAAFVDLAGADVYYACKAFASVGVCRWALEEGLRLDTCSEGEMRTALAAGATGEQLGLHGNNKSRREIQQALEHEVGHLVVDSLAELAHVADVAHWGDDGGTVAKVMLRVTTGIHAGGHEYISTAHEDQKFGLSIASGEAWEAISETLRHPRLQLVGLHSHIGSQIFASEGFVAAARALMDLRARVYTEHGIVLPEVDFGGGFGIRYTAADPAPLRPETYAQALAEVVRTHTAETGIPAPRVSIEPGRSIIGPAGVTLYEVGTIKNVQLEGGRTRRYISVDGGMSDNIRPALYGANYTAALANRVPEKPSMVKSAAANAAATAADAVTADASAAGTSTADEGTGSAGVVSRVVGKHCESGDIVVRDVSLPADVTAGDILAVPATGAYGRSMASNYNMLPRPGVISVRDGQAHWLVYSEEVPDLLSLDAEYTGE